MTALSDCIDQKVKLHTELGERDSALVASQAASAALLALCLAYQKEHDMRQYGYQGCQCGLCDRVNRMVAGGD